MSSSLPIVQTLPEMKRIGYIKKKIHTKENYLWVAHAFEREVAFEQGCFIFVELYTACFIPFQVKRASSIDRTTMNVSLDRQEELSNPRTLAQKSVYIEASRVAHYAALDAFILVENFDLYAQNHYVGRIKAEMPMRSDMRMLVLERKGQELTLPYHPSLLLSVDISAKKMTINLPDTFSEALH